MLTIAFRQSLRDVWLGFLQSRLRAELRGEPLPCIDMSDGDPGPAGCSSQPAQARKTVSTSVHQFAERTRQCKPVTAGFRI